jgi:hypothetical protein
MPTGRLSGPSRTAAVLAITMSLCACTAMLSRTAMKRVPI